MNLIQALCIHSENMAVFQPLKDSFENEMVSESPGLAVQGIKRGLSLFSLELVLILWLIYLFYHTVVWETLF